MKGKRRRIQKYEIVKICLALCFVAALKVWDSTQTMPLALLTFFIPFLTYFIMNGIRVYLRRKALVESGIHVIDSMSGEEFEEFLLAHFINLGYIGQTTAKTGDYWADLVLEKDNRRIVVQAKRWRNFVGIGAVQQVIGAIKYYSAVKGMVITNIVFTENAYQLANANGIELVDREKLIGMMRESQGKGISNDFHGRAAPETDNTPGILPGENCPLCHRLLVRRKGKYGEFIGCSGFPACRFTRQI